MMKEVKAIVLGPSLLQQGGMATVQNLIVKHAPAEIQIKHISTHEDGTLARRIFVFGQAVLLLLWKLLKKDVDLAHIHLAERGSVLRKGILTLIAILFGKPVLLHAHGSEFKPFYESLPEWGQQLVARIFRQSTYFIVLSESWQDFYKSSLNLRTEQVAVLPNAIEIPTIVPDRQGSELVKFLFLGRIGDRKGAFDLIRAFAQLSPEGKKRSQLVLAGDGEVERARKEVASLELQNSVSILDWVDSEKRNDLFSTADVFVLPSYNEGLPMALLEAMSWGLPAIATPVGGIPEAIVPNENGLLVEPGNIEQLSAAMQSLIDNENLRLSLGTAARTLVARRFDIEKYCSSLARLYRLALG